jgi:hypothetical protein
MVLSVRPHYIFDQVPADRREYTVSVPERESGSLTLLETYVLISIARIVNAAHVFEIGTFKGITARNLARNIDGCIHTLDLSEKFASFGPFSNITGHVGHSLAFDFSPFHRKMDLVFIDGGHDYDTVAADSYRASQIIKKEGEAAIVWHDYANPRYPAVKAFVDQTDSAEGGWYFHIEETHLAVRFFGASTLAV